jgi:uncharacterized protein YihD (DUF1040 family)
MTSKEKEQKKLEEELRSSVYLAVAYSKRTSAPEFAVPAIKKFAKTYCPDFFDNYMKGYLEKKQQEIIKDKMNGYIKLPDDIDYFLSKGAEDFEKGFKKSKVSSIISLVEEAGYTGSIKELKNYLRPYMNYVCQDIKDKGVKAIIELLKTIWLKHADSHIMKEEAKSLDKEVERGIKDLLQKK